MLSPSPFQPVTRDFAFIVDHDVAAENLLRAAKGADKDLISGVGLFDDYQGKGVGDGKKSLAIWVTLQPKTATLTEDEINSAADRIVAAVAKSCGGELRG
jgi:phenylalanyl-tRNA synthetase beta chain